MISQRCVVWSLTSVVESNFWIPQLCRFPIKDCIPGRHCSSSAMTSRREQPPWTVPEAMTTPQLHLYNSLTRRKELFVAARGRRVTWYSCGPTVYDASHMGHARSYITFDILRRVLSDYFGYDVLYVMNVTDVDDKIILRARQSHLLDQYSAAEQCSATLLSDATETLQMIGDKMTAETDADKRALLKRQHSKLQSVVAQIQSAVSSNDQSAVQISKQELLDSCGDCISQLLDKRHGATITDNAIFSQLPRHWENEYHKDMAALNILPPSVLTRVSEYMSEIVDFIATIVDKGLAYVAASGSVYFDVAKFDSDKHHHYAKLVPEAYGDASALQEGEGALSETVSAQAAEKRSDTDFALWKRSRPGEPSWASPWGPGRPGWHIECSVMASQICGSGMDIHTGGVDLKFPHHDNELAQSEAYHDNDSWVRYFLHSGHLTIAGCKMSKSLKNFITIQEALSRHTARQLRLMFLLHSWKDTLDYSDNTMEQAVNFEKFTNEFFLYVRALMASGPGPETSSFYRKWSASELQLQQRLTDTQVEVHRALCDNVDTRSCLDSVRSLIGCANVYISQSASGANRQLLGDVARYVTRLLKLFGAVPVDGPEIGFPSQSASVQGGANTDVETVVAPYLSVLGEFRERVRCVAREQRIGSLLEECDRLRDQHLAELGVRLEDREGGSSVLKLVGREAIMRERQERQSAEQQKQLEKERRRVEQLRLQQETAEKRKISPAEMFTQQTDKYSKFDDKGLPTHDSDGQELSKGQLKKLAKLQQNQEKLYSQYLQETNGGTG